MSADPSVGGYEAGQVLADRYRVIRPVGRGGMAAVYQAHDTNLDSEVALKVLFDQYRSHPIVCDRFKQEVIAARAIVHPAIIRIFDLVDTEQALFLTMEYVDGKDGKYLLRERGRFPADEAVAIARQICSGLEAAHAEGIVHGDIKPHNVLIDGEDRVKIVDFGMARVNTVAGITAHSIVLGTPEYAAPEVFTDRFMDARADIYSIGVLMYELVTGKLPYRGKTPYEVIHLKTESKPPSASSHAPDLPGWLEGVINKAMSPSPADRFQSARELSEALEGESANILPALTSSAAKACRHCNADLLEAFPFCLGCGKDSTFVRQVPNGRYMVMASRPMNLRFFRGANPYDTLTYEQKYHLVDRVKDATGQRPEDTTPIDRRMKYPPFVVIDRLSEQDADKLQADLKERSISAHVIKNDRLRLLRFVYRHPPLIVASLLGMGSFAMMLTAMVALKALDSLPILLSAMLPIVVIGALWQWSTMRPLSDLVEKKSLWHRLFRRGRALPAGDPIVQAEKDRAAVGWIVPIAKNIRSNVTGKGLKRTLGRLIGRAVLLERTLTRIDWLSDDARRGYREHLETALRRAGDMCISIQRADDFLSGTDEFEIFDSIEHCSRRLTEADADANAIGQLMSQQKDLLSQRDLIERQRTQTYASLLQLVTRLDGLHARLARVAQSETELAQSDLRDAMTELETEIEGIREVAEI